MFKLSKTVEYALISINHINKYGSGMPVSVRQISDFHNIPYDLLAKILQKMSKAQILISIKGPKGGYNIKSKYTDLTLIDFIEIIEGPFGIAGCFVDVDCNQSTNCNIINPLEKINSKIYQVFSDIKLNQLT